MNIFISYWNWRGEIEIERDSEKRYNVFSLPSKITPSSQRRLLKYLSQHKWSFDTHYGPVYEYGYGYDRDEYEVFTTPPEIDSKSKQRDAWCYLHYAITGQPVRIHNFAYRARVRRGKVK